ncbi:MAG: hypothetical protein H6704_27915 [Myxococcales bacterium]|nr:hypothetical protein [Myxococcales bacterium]
MAQFLGDVAGMLELFAIAAGLVLLHEASKEPAAKLLKAAGLVLVVGGIAVGLCTSFYWFKYQAAGNFERAMPIHVQVSPGSVPGTHMVPGVHGDADAAAPR